MNTPVSGLYIAANTTAFNVPNAATLFVTSMVAAVFGHGELSVVPTAASGKLTCVPGIYEVVAELSIEGEYTSATSGDAVGIIAAQFYVGGSAVTGAKSKVSLEAEGQIECLKLTWIVEITKAQVDAGTNYIQLYLSSGDSSGNDVIVREGRFYAKRLD